MYHILGAAVRMFCPGEGHATVPSLPGSEADVKERYPSLRNITEHLVPSCQHTRFQNVCYRGSIGITSLFVLIMTSE